MRIKANSKLEHDFTSGECACGATPELVNGIASVRPNNPADSSSNTETTTKENGCGSSVMSISGVGIVGGFTAMLLRKKRKEN